MTAWLKGNQICCLIDLLPNLFHARANLGSRLKMSSGMLLLFSSFASIHTLCNIMLLFPVQTSTADILKMKSGKLGIFVVDLHFVS